jgi:predicted anti-sigma-YlaC factor YlaD
MMTCAQVRDVLLEADLAELRGPPSTALAEHLATCAECGRWAEQIIATTEALARDQMQGPRREVEGVLAAARAEADRIRRTRRRWLGAVPALTAAGIAAIMLARSWGPGLPSAPSAAPAAAAAPADIPLVGSTAHTVVVFKTANPNIVVVWQF